MTKKILVFILKSVIDFFVSLGCVTFGWNVLLTRVFESVTTLSFGKLCLFSVAIPLILYPVTYTVTGTVKRLLNKSVN